jgi:hypothetical protein
MLGIGSAIDAYHGNAPYTTLLNYLTGDVGTSGTGGVSTLTVGAGLESSGGQEQNNGTVVTSPTGVITKQH